MEHTAARRRLPRAGIDTIGDAASALATVALAIGRPLRDETIVIVLDEARRGRAIVVVSGTVAADSVIDVVECVTQGDGCEHIGAIVVASVRPDAGIDPSDIDRWLEMSEIAELAGVELLEWFVIGRSISCPRDHLGEPPRW